MSKAELLRVEGECTQLEQSATQARHEVRNANRLYIERKAFQDRIDAELQRQRSETKFLQKVGKDKRDAIEQTKLQILKLQGPIADSDASLAVEQEALGAARAAKQRLKEIPSLIGAVREELRALASPEGKKAALEAAGAQLPEAVVPPPAPEADLAEEPMDLQALWLGTGPPETHMTSELRPALQTQAVLAALQRVLVVRNAELREGLRQWSFSRCATARAKELAEGLSRSISETTNECRAIDKDRTQMEDERLADTHALAALRATDAQQRHRYDEAVADHQTACADVASLQVLIENTKDLLRAVQHDSFRTTEDQKSVQKQIDEHQSTLSSHPQEAERRTMAAERLATRGADQVVKCTEELAQSQRELSSFRQAHQVLKEAHVNIMAELEAERAAHENFIDEHDSLNFELNALARHYMALLPQGLPLPGFAGASDTLSPCDSQCPLVIGLD